MSKPIVWTIAGSDSGGGAGIQADLHTFQALGAHGCSVIAAITAQNSRVVQQIEYCSPEMITAQIQALMADMPPRAIKLGMLGSITAMQAVLPALERFPNAVICDPVLHASVGQSLHEGDTRKFLLHYFLPQVTLLTPNIPEAEWLLGRRIKTTRDMEKAARELLKMGPKAVFIKGGHATNKKVSQDFWTDGHSAFWLTNKRLTTPHRHGTGCTLSSAIAACLALNYSMPDALVIAKAYVNQGLRLAEPVGHGNGHVAHGAWPSEQQDFPWLTEDPDLALENFSFPQCGTERLGFYPIVDSIDWVKRLLDNNVKTLQVRIKDRPIEEELKTCITLAKNAGARLFVNDAWEIALKYGAFGVHLGQEDIASLTKADFQKLAEAGICLGISTHSYAEIARAHALKPSYIAIGPIYHTTTKKVAAPPQGLDNLQRYCSMLKYPIVAIGGINLQNLPHVFNTGIDGIAVISAITSAADPDAEMRKWQEFFNGKRSHANE